MVVLQTHGITAVSYTHLDVYKRQDLMNDIKTLVVDKYDGSLKAEHGTGRNMAPFVCHAVSSDKVPHPVAVRYAYKNYAEANVFNIHGRHLCRRSEVHARRGALLGK